MKTDTERGTRSGHGGASSAPAEMKYSGLGVSAGIAIGPAHVMERGLIDVPDYCVTDVDAELKRFDGAVRQSIEQVEKLRTKASALTEAAAEELTYLLEAHRQMLAGSRLVRGVEDRIRAEKLNAEAAVQAELSQIAHAFSAMEDSYLAGKIQDVREVSFSRAAWAAELVRGEAVRQVQLLRLQAELERRGFTGPESIDALHRDVTRLFAASPLEILHRETWERFLDAGGRRPGLEQGEWRWLSQSNPQQEGVFRYMEAPIPPLGKDNHFVTVLLHELSAPTLPAHGLVPYAPG